MLITQVWFFAMKDLNNSYYKSGEICDNRLHFKIHIISDLTCTYGAAFTANQDALRHWKRWIMSCSCVNTHSSTLHSKTHSTYVWLIKLQTFCNCSKPYCAFDFSIGHGVSLSLNLKSGAQSNPVPKNPSYGPVDTSALYNKWFIPLWS